MLKFEKKFNGSSLPLK